MFPVNIFCIARALSVFLHRHHLNTNHANNKTEYGGNEVPDGEWSLRKYIEHKNNAGPFSNIEHGVLDRVEEWENDGEADDVIESMADGGDDEKIVNLAARTCYERRILIVPKNIRE